VTEPRIALFVDGDNISPVHADLILKAAKRRGRVDVSRVYGQANRTSDWLTAPGFRMIHAGCGKNAADVLLCIDAIEMAITGVWDTFVIATSDGDFTHLVQRLRERGMTVCGIGEAKAPMSFRTACSDFVQVGAQSKSAAKPNVSPEIKTEKPPALQPKPSLPDLSCFGQISQLDQNIIYMMMSQKTPAQGMKITDVNIRMKSKFGFLIGAVEEKTWRAYFSKRPDLYSLDPKGPDAKVRYRKPALSAAFQSVTLAAE